MRLEMEIINLRQDYGKIEMDMHNKNINLKETESTIKTLEENIQLLNNQLNQSNDTNNRLKTNISEIEDGVLRKNQQIEGLKEDMVQMEREMHVEVRRLR